ncbi:formylglycine-generating enzyme family protein [uncultured Ruegeria sp.]|uniref:formylglycine-generating enzyme family protein n=1 Tax=uncultured Ruegeria sp. TaxID=259304 RepID=UPI00261B402E|nr:formylglycine-generating enzyme family protein [uncultured Ruegeria sp.]
MKQTTSDTFQDGTEMNLSDHKNKKIKQFIEVNSVTELVSACLLWLTCLAPGLLIAEESKLYSLKNGQTVAPLEQFQECEQCPEMIVMPLGSFMMGATQEESRDPFDFYGENATKTRRAPDDIHIIPHEHPRHEVEIDIPFAMGRNEVTHAEWMRCVNAERCTHNPEHRILRLGGYVLLGPDHPVINVSFEDAQEYLSWLNSLVGDDVYRLPTEAEWEYSAKAGAQTRYAQGNDITAEQANFSGDATETTLGVRPPGLADRDMSVRVEELDAANSWGLRHMSGNVQEITQSCWSETHLGLASDSEYLNLQPGTNNCWRVLKGGSYATGIDGLRPAMRRKTRPEWRNDSHGFRVVRELNLGK